MSDLKAAIDQANGDLAGALARGDAATMARCYTNEGVLLPPGSDQVVGQEGIEAFWGAVMGMGIASAKLETLEVEDRGDTAIEVGRYTLGTSDGEVADEGKYLVVWKNEGGDWKLHRDIWNTSRS